MTAATAMAAMTTKTINIAAEFYPHPGVRYQADGPGSGEEFREKFLLPALRDYQFVIVDLTGATGFGSSFLDEGFAGLIKYKSFALDELKKRLQFSPHNSVYAAEAWGYMQDESRRS